jgi:hypothetical protein
MRSESYWSKENVMFLLKMGSLVDFTYSRYEVRRLDITSEPCVYYILRWRRLEGVVPSLVIFS